MSLSLFVFGLVSILLGLAIIVRDKLTFRIVTMRMAAAKEKTLLDAITNLINALAAFTEKLFGQFAPKEKLPIFLMIIGLVFCGFGWWLAQ